MGKTNNNQNSEHPLTKKIKTKKKEEKKKKNQGRKERKKNENDQSRPRWSWITRVKAQAKNYSLRWKEIRIVLQISNRERLNRKMLHEETKYRGRVRVQISYTTQCQFKVLQCKKIFRVRLGYFWEDPHIHLDKFFPSFLPSFLPSFQ